MASGRQFVGMRPNAKRAAYSLAAGAAMSGGMALDAEAEIIYSGFADLVVYQGLGPQPLAFNYDDYTDVLLKNYIFSGVNYQAVTVPYSPGQVVGFSTNGADPFGEYVTALSKGDLIDATTVGPTFYGTMAFGDGNPEAQFRDVTNAYIGLSFPQGTDLRYAWIRVDVNNEAGTLIIRDWAWESEIGVGILAGDTGLPDGDFDVDSDVDGADFLLWQQGDTQDPLSDTDLQAWQADFGTGVDPGAAIKSVPEPGTLGLLAAGAAGLGLLRRTRR